MTKEKPVSVIDIATKIKESPEVVLQHVVTLKDRDLIRMDHIDGDTPYYVFQSHEEPDSSPETATIDSSPATATATANPPDTGGP
jgi:predicted ArsR family transcriptional regulator